MSIGHGKGFALLGLMAMVRERYGQAMLDGWLQTLDTHWRQQLTQNLVLAPSWVPLDLYFGCVQHVCKGDPEKARKLGHDTAERAISSFFKAVLQFTSPALVIGVSSRFWSSYFDVGALKVVTNRPGHVAIEVTKWPLVDLVTANELGGSFLAWVERSRGKDVVLESAGQIGPDSLRFELSWH